MKCSLIEMPILVTFVIVLAACTQEAAPTPQEPSATLEETLQALTDLRMQRYDAALALLAARHRAPLETLQSLVLWYDSVTSPWAYTLDRGATFEFYSELPVVLDSVSAALGIETAVATDVLLWVELLEAAESAR